jgi:hypothetical protein
VAGVVQGIKRKMLPWFWQMKSLPDGVGELPDATNESCEDIMPPEGEMPSKV